MESQYFFCLFRLLRKFVIVFVTPYFIARETPVSEKKLYLHSLTILRFGLVTFLAGPEEGRIRYKPAVGSLPANFACDYFIKDHLGNVRMVLTDEMQEDIYPAATLEPALTGVEGAFYTIDQSKIVANSAANYLRDGNQNPQTCENNNIVFKEDVAKILEVNESTVFQYENEKHTPHKKMAKKIKSL